jgi:hypothetical protein
MAVGSVSLMSGQGSQSAMAAQVAQFLNVPFEETLRRILVAASM